MDCLLEHPLTRNCSAARISRVLWRIPESNYCIHNELRDRATVGMDVMGH